MKINHVLLVYIMLLGFGCTESIDKSTLKKMLNSNDRPEIIEAINYISATNDTLMVKNLLENSFDPRIIHDIRYKGMSVYQLKMGAMKEMTNIAPPNKITPEPDSANIKFYIEIATKRGWLK